MARPTKLVLETPEQGDVADLVALARASRRLHRPWVYLPESASGWRSYLERCRRGAVMGHLLRRADTRELVGVVNISEVVRGRFQSGYLGFYVHAAHAGQGLMRLGLAEVATLAFRVHRLHRLEANIQPGNERSRRLVKRLGFRCEGLSPRYLKIGGRWRDHERWAITSEAWRAGRRRTTRG
jgi:[ribosomal protein S5]-alanine N-acetyltransferase